MDTVPSTIAVSANTRGSLGEMPNSSPRSRGAMPSATTKPAPIPVAIRVTAGSGRKLRPRRDLVTEDGARCRLRQNVECLAPDGTTIQQSVQAQRPGAVVADEQRSAEHRQVFQEHRSFNLIGQWI